MIETILDHQFRNRQQSICHNVDFATRQIRAGKNQNYFYLKGKELSLNAKGTAQILDTLHR
jgi:hypothetical protein